MDDAIKTTTRLTYNSIDALTATGGFASIIMLVFKLLTNKIQKILYLSSIMRKVFLYVDDRYKNQLDEFNSLNNALQGN